MKIFSEAMTIGYGALHATIASGRVRLATQRRRKDREMSVAALELIEG